ncbi:hypothetical protein GE09DRAFT_137343 [Coniochaeta sp. 2T2.1]|nr:hypothetical protein GE09DRAFT_137343 [Coniochaeta sp. 2T2.1]
MASPAPAASRPETGDILVVIHDFVARSSDELSLSKGDRVELIERDDEFGDGWFLGKHLVNGNSGLFPEVYTRPAPRITTTSPPNNVTTPKPTTTLAPVVETANDEAPPSPTRASQTITPVSKSPENMQTTPTPKPLSSLFTNPTMPSTAPQPNYTAKTGPSLSTSSVGSIGSLMRPNTAQDSQVLHDTLNVINEHITDLSATQGNGALRPGHSGNDSGSEYSSHLDQRMSYIQGEETDEEEDGAHSREEVLSWSADDVAEYLFTIGVEKHHCEVFRDQEITGEVILGMDQTSVFIKALDLGSVGRRLKTWQKIKALQDEVNGFGTSTRRTTQTYGSEADSDATGRARSRTGTFTSQRLEPIDDRPMSVQTKRLSLTQTPKMDAMQPMTPVSPLTDSPTRPAHEKRPSAASVRDLHHSRRFSSTDFRLTGTTLNPTTVTPKLVSSGTFPQTTEVATHKKQPSFDRNWTLGSATQSAYSPRPLSSTFQDVITSEPELQDSAVDLDRGYFSGPDGDPKRRNVLKKRDSTTAAPHERKSSYAEEQRIRSGTALSRHSRFGSVESISAAASKYYGLATGPHRRTASTNTTESIRPIAGTMDSPSPTVTKLDDSLRSASAATPISPANRQGTMHVDWPGKANNLKPNFGLRAISDAVTGTERQKLASPIDSPFKETSLDSPSRAGSSTPSAGPSFELDSPDFAKSPNTATATTGKGNARKKSKKETSAYLRGLQKITPRQAIVDADYSGWMKKKSSNLMTTWKPRLFVLKGRRLAYYYSEDDDQEKGLIDISFHRVLPADNEKLTGLHATLTGAGASPAIPAGSHVPTLAATEAESDKTKESDAMFIFKLVPPRAGLSRAVNFTKPTVHYFACPNLKQGRLWMAALMKATIDRDDTQAITTTYQQKTISLAKARAMRHRPPALRDLDERGEVDDVPDENEEGAQEKKRKDSNGLGIYDAAREKMGLGKVESARARGFSFATGEKNERELPLSA